jgi:Holliday junction resolvase RusA-like endonuclease
MTVSFFVSGSPSPGGSKSAFLNKRTGRIIVTDAGGKKTKDWRARVREVASSYFIYPATTRPVRVVCNLVLRRPKSHYNKKGLKENAPQYHVSKPDATKLWRSTEDALVNIAWRDDSQVISQLICKTYGEETGAWISVEEVE